MFLTQKVSLDTGSRPVSLAPDPLCKHCPDRRAYPLQARSKRQTRSCPTLEPVRAAGGSGSGRGTGTGSGDGGGEEDSGKRGARSILIALLLLAGAAGAICLFSPLGSDTAEDDGSEEDLIEQTDKDVVKSADRQQASQSGSSKGPEMEEQQRYDMRCHDVLCAQGCQSCVCWAQAVATQLLIPTSVSTVPHHLCLFIALTDGACSHPVLSPRILLVCVRVAVLRLIPSIPTCRHAHRLEHAGRREHCHRSRPPSSTNQRKPTWSRSSVHATMLWPGNSARSQSCSSTWTP